MTNELDTIAAISTTLGEAAIGVIRISGPESKKILDSIFVANKGKIEPRQHSIGWILEPDKSKKTDQAIAVYMPPPNTFTGEDIVEIYCHGGVALMKCVLEIIIRQGARLADRGEFTKRAFLNGKIDLVQAEAVIDMIKAKTGKALYAAAERLDGRLSRDISRMKEDLTNILTEIEVSVDFPEDVNEPEIDVIKPRIEGHFKKISTLLTNAEYGRILNEGITVSIIGSPNVGKSSILNALLKKERAIVTDIPGTTTDTIEEVISLNGYPFRIIDTAGIRDAKNRIEEAGIERTNKAINQSEIILAVFDWSEECGAFDDEIVKMLKNHKNVIIVINKIDKTRKFDEHKINGFNRTVKTSALLGEGITELEDRLINMVIPNKEIDNSALLSNSRQIQSLTRAHDSIKRTVESLNSRVPVDIAAIDVKDAIASLGEITGETVSLDVINRIFSNFCVGK